MRRILLPLVLGVSFLALLGSATPRAVADDDGDEAEIRVQAPLEIVDCGASTITVLGLLVDIHNAPIVGDECGEGDDDDDFDDDDDDDDDNDQDSTLTCADLELGEFVEVRLVSDLAPLVATEVRLADEEDDDDWDDNHQTVEIEAPLQGVDLEEETILVLGLSIDASRAKIEGEDDEEENDDDGEVGEGDDCDEELDLEDLIVGQFVDVELDSSHPPFRADVIEIQNFSNQLEIAVLDHSGQPVGEVGDDGLSISSLTVDVVTKVSIPKRSAADSGGGQRRTMKLRLHGTVSGGTFVLSGLPAGRAKLAVTCVADEGTSKGRSRVEVLSGASMPAVVRLKKPRAH